MLELLKIQNKISKKFEYGAGKKENEIYKIISEADMLTKYIKGQGFVIPSLKKPKKVIFTKMNHPKTFNLSFESNMSYNLIKKDKYTIMQGALSGVINVSLLLSMLDKDFIEDTIIVFIEDENSISRFINTINEEIKNDLVYIYIGLISDVEEKDVYIEANSKSLFKYVKSLYNKLNVNITYEQRYRDYKFISLFLPTKNTLNNFSSKVKLNTIEMFKIFLKKIKSEEFDIEIEKVEDNSMSKEEFFNALELDILENNIKFENLKFILNYLTEKYVTQGTIHLNFLKTKENEKELERLMNLLLDYELIVPCGNENITYKFI